MMNYSEVLTFLYQQLPVFHREGKKAFKPGLRHIEYLCEYFGHPERQLKCLHIAGTNGKGSSSHLMSSILQEHGYRVGLYTSPHLKNFTERFKVNGVEIPEQWITDFVNEHQAFIKSYSASFFEWTVIMAFLYFAQQKVDYAVIETGLGGRLDSTNIMTPIGCLITNISFDHQDLLGNTLEEIATEKAGIIKKNVPITISEYHPQTAPIFEQKAKLEHAPIIFASKIELPKGLQIKSPFLGNYQTKNIQGVIAWAVQLNSLGIISFDWKKLEKGIEHTLKNTGFKGRFQVIHTNQPQIIVDTAHNEAGISSVVAQIEQLHPKELTIILGMVGDKDVKKVLSILPKNAHYIFTEITNPRKLPKEELHKMAIESGLDGILSSDVNHAITHVKEYRKDHLVFILGSTYLVAEINEL
ncbi:MAG: Dihydrofolate synthase [Bacteroidota bacterium]|jgi:dihydrofolate synthase/folylpolyglutamate synthase